jgi:prolyl-tRNA editing enzyme YbaK/EbsC (Cys-tRNA(Pro) deacylase)
MMHSMDIHLGTLKFFSALTKEELLAEEVKAALRLLLSNETVGVAAIDPSASDTEQFCKQYGIEIQQVANCVILEAKQGTKRSYAAAVVLGSTRADVNGLMKKTLQVRKVSFAGMEIAVALSGMEYGAITPIGLPSGWPIFIDKRVAASDYLIIGSGVRNSKLAVRGAFLATLPRVTVLEDLGLDKSVYGKS